MRNRWFLFFIPLLLSLPFLQRAYFVDDNYFVEISRWLTQHPDKPYEFRTDDAGLQNLGWEKDGLVRMVNPLGHHYYLALLIKLGGENTWWLRLGCVLLSCFSALFIFGFARRFTDHPTIATLLVLCTPVFWLTAHSLLIDSTMAFFFLGGVYFFVRMTETEKFSTSILSGVFMGAAILCKYPAVMALPLTAVWVFLRWKKITKKYLVFIPWGLALSSLLAYSLWTKHLYGEMHIVAASGRMVHTLGWPKMISFFVFFSGAALVPVLSWFVASRKVVLPSLLGVSLLLLFFFSPMGGFDKIQSALLGFWLVTSVLTLGLFLVRYQQWLFPRDHFLFFWVSGFIVMMLVVMDWVAARYYAIVIPALVFIVVRLVEFKWRPSALKILKPALALVFLLSGLLAYADFKQAEPARLLGGELKKAGFVGGPRHFYLGDSFTMSYLKEDGWIPCFPETSFQVGDLILAKEVTMPLVWINQKPIVLNRLATFEYPTRFPLKVMDYHGSAGFYASVWGALPFTISKSSWERFQVFEVAALKQHESR